MSKHYEQLAAAITSGQYATLRAARQAISSRFMKMREPKREQLRQLAEKHFATPKPPKPPKVKKAATVPLIPMARIDLPTPQDLEVRLLASAGLYKEVRALSEKHRISVATICGDVLRLHELYRAIEMNPALGTDNPQLGVNGTGNGHSAFA